MRERAAQLAQKLWKLTEIGVEQLNRYVARKSEHLEPRTLNRHLNLLHALFKAAEGRELVRSNLVSAVDRPREPRRRWTILTPVEIGRIERAFRELADEDPDQRVWIEQARVIFLTVLSVGLRRGEILGLRWRDISLADPAGATVRVRETWVRSQRDTPKSERSERTSAIGRLAGELFEHRGRSAFQGDEERVFCHPESGGPLDQARYAGGAQASADRPTDAAVPRRQAHVDHERGRGGRLTGGPHGSRGSLGLQDDSGLHRPGGGDVPRGSGAGRRAHVRRRWPKVRAKVEPCRWWSPERSDTTRREKPHMSGAFLKAERRRSRTYPATGYAASPVLKTGWATGPEPLRA
jgi:integrase